jgi:putative hydrolase of the HAD superfamily
LDPLHDAVLLDVGGVLTLPDPGVVRPALEPFGPSPTAETLDRAHYEAVNAMDRGSIPARDYHDAWLTAYVIASGVSARSAAPAARRLDEAISRAEHPWSRIAPGAPEGLRGISETGTRLALVSNTLRGRVEEGLRHLGLCQVGSGPGQEVTAIIDSARVGVAKPDPEIFKLALRAVDARADRAVFVGDSVLVDVEGARGAGMAALHFDPYRRCDGDDHEDLATLTEVADRILRGG